MRGENQAVGFPDCPHVGPSPHAWGKRYSWLFNSNRLRTIPTCVGKTSPGHTPRRPSSDHPHMRGENQSKLTSEPPSIGPSPHAWGKPVSRTVDTLSSRTIPTCVGKTGLNAVSRTADTDHPHMRGENATRRPMMDILSGPSPHAWGKLPELANMKYTERTIPTCVGKTNYERKHWNTNADHPHMRGENPVPVHPVALLPGPSPHAWGKRRWRTLCIQS